MVRNIVCLLLFFVIVKVSNPSYIIKAQAEKEIEMAEHEVKARAALIAYIKHVVLDQDNPAGAAIRGAILDFRSLQDRAEVERELLAQAEAFPKIVNKINQSEPWQFAQSRDPDNPCYYYYGRIFGLAVEIEFEVDSVEVKKVYIEVD
ncbi:MAG: hypothetical protein AB1489_12305 [Acidobacteriota bacterium]